jgi:hypothetical protein
MPKMLLGNILFIAILGGWYFYTDGDRSLMLAGTVMAFGCFVSGIFMGYVLHTPPKRRTAPPEAATAHERLIETSMAHTSQADEGGNDADSAQDSLIETDDEAHKAEDEEKVAEEEKVDVESSQNGDPPASAEATTVHSGKGDKTAAEVEAVPESDSPAIV